MFVVALIGVAAVAALIGVLATKSCSTSTVIVQSAADARLAVEDARVEDARVAIADTHVVEDANLGLLIVGVDAKVATKRGSTPPKDAAVSVARVQPDAAEPVKETEPPPDAAPPELSKPPSIDRSIEFALQDPTMPAGHDALLKELRQLAAAHPRMIIVIEGDALLDESRTPDQLAAARANSVMTRLPGVSRAQLQVSGKARGSRSVRITTR